MVQIMIVLVRYYQQGRAVASVLMVSFMPLQTTSVFKQPMREGLCQAELFQNSAIKFLNSFFLLQVLALRLAVMPGPAVTLTHS